MVRAIITAKPLTTKRVDQLATSADDPQLLAKIRKQLERMVGTGDSTWSTQLLRYSIRS
jgi:hypothetical protein